MKKLIIAVKIIVTMFGGLLANNDEHSFKPWKYQEATECMSAYADWCEELCSQSNRNIIEIEFYSVEDEYIVYTVVDGDGNPIGRLYYGGWLKYIDNIHERARCAYGALSYCAYYCWGVIF